MAYWTATTAVMSWVVVSVNVFNYCNIIIIVIIIIIVTIIITVALLLCHYKIVVFVS